MTTKNLTIRNFLNEMSYDLRLGEIEEVILKYQDVIIKYFVKSRFVYKEKRRFEELCGVLRSEKIIRTMETLIEKEPVNTDLAHCLMVAVSELPSDDERKNDVWKIAYLLEHANFEDEIKDKKVLSIAAYLGAWCIRGYELDSMYRVKSAQMVIKYLPGCLLGEYGSINPKRFTKNFFYKLFSVLIPDITIVELIEAFSKSGFDYSKKERPYAIRMRGFMFELINATRYEDAEKAIIRACDSIVRRNNKNRFNTQLSLEDMYLDYNVIRVLVNGDAIWKADNEITKGIMTAWSILKNMKKQIKYDSIMTY